uniref:helix-turn-helix domain-containing protein n=1 Tax=Serratia proteamaculans TaxID=28151 RepID=UPI003B66D64D
MTSSKIESAKKLLASGIPPRDVAKDLGVSIPTLYRCAGCRHQSILRLHAGNIWHFHEEMNDRLNRRAATVGEDSS